MKNAAPWAGWGIAAIAVAALCGALWVCHQKNVEIDALRTSLVEAQARADQLALAAQRDATAIDELKRKLADLQKASAPWAGGADSGSLAGRLIKSLLAQSLSGADSTKSGDWVGHFVAGLAGFVGSEEGKEIIGLSVDVIADELYDQFFGKTGLPSDVEDAARDIIARNLRDDVNAVLDLFRGGFDMKKAFATFENFRKNPSDERIRAELAGVLDADQLAQWDQRNAAMEQEDPKRIMEGALMMSVPDLTPDNRTKVAEALAEEMRASHDARASMSFTDLLDFQKFIESTMSEQQAIYDRAQERLSQQLDADQMKVVDRYLHTQQRAADVGARVVSFLFGSAKPATP